MISIAPRLTDAGRSLLIRGLDGETITFTRFKIGNGELDGVNPDTLSDLINPLIAFGIDATDTSNPGFIKLTGTFDNSGVTGDFRWRELGIFAQGEDEVEWLYAYSNDGDDAGIMKRAQSDVVVEQTVNLVVAIGRAENVTAIMTGSSLYASKEEFDAHVADRNNPHGMTKAQLGLENVENVAVDDMTPTITAQSVWDSIVNGMNLSTIVSKVAAAVAALHAHITSTANPHGLTPAGIGAARAEHTHNASDITAGTLAVARGGTGGTTAATARKKLGACTFVDYSINVPVTGWSGSAAPYTRTITVSGMLSTDAPLMDVVQTGTWATDAAARNSWNCITRAVANDGSVTLTADAIPPTAFKIQARCIR